MPAARLLNAVRALALPLVLGGTALAASLPAQALEFRSVGVPVAILYENPSAQSKKLFLARKYTPLDIISSSRNWARVRGPDSTLSWIELKQLSSTRTVMVTANRASVRQAADDAAPVVFEAEKSVALFLLEEGEEWAKVKHLDGATGYIRTRLIWGL